MGTIAFQGRADLKGEALARLRSHFAAGTFVFYPAWEDGKANVIGALIEADDKQAFADRFGYPVALANALEAIVNASKTLPAAHQFVEDLVECTPVGADLSALVPQLLICLLELPELVALTAEVDEVEALRQQVVAMHRKAVAGDPADRKEWKVVRLAAVAASDTLEHSPIIQLASQVVEAAAWPDTMRTVLHDTLGACGRLETQQMLARIGWSMEDEHRVFKIREAAERDGRKAELSGLDRVLSLLDEDDPALAKGFRVRLENFGSLGGTYRDIGRQLIQLVKTAQLGVAAS